MCDTCGCGDKKNTRVGGKRVDHDHGHSHEHDHDHEHDHEKGRVVKIERDILEKNREYADRNRDFFREKNILTLNLLSSPGAGKTTLLVNTIKALRQKSQAVPQIAVIEGDQETSLDAEKIRETGVAAIQINTGKGCHLDAHMIEHAASDLALKEGSILFVENVGNLVCPADFDLGESYKVVLLSVTEGEDKPLKYPNIFARADVLLLNKIDLLSYLRFNVEQCLSFARKINPNLKIFKVSGLTSEGLTEWLAWLDEVRSSTKAR